MATFKPAPIQGADEPGWDSPDNLPSAAVAPLQPMQTQLRGTNTSEGNLASATADLIGKDAAPAMRANVPPAVAGGGFKRMASSVGNFIKDNPVGVANGVLGAAGAIINGTTKQPEMPAYQDFTPTLAPATGMDPGQKAQLIAHITSNMQRAGQPQTFDANLATAGRLAAATNAGEQQMQVQQQDSQLFQQNQQRRADQQLQVDQTNFQGRTQQRQAKFDLDNRRAETRKATGTAMVQGAATYLTQADAAKRQETQNDLQAQYQNDAQKIQERYTQLSLAKASPNLTPEQVAGIEAQLAQLRSQASVGPRQTLTTKTTTVRRFGGRVPRVQVYSQGGSATRQVSVNSHGPKVDKLAQVEQHFRRSLEAVTQQATHQFAETLRTVLGIRTRPLARH